MIKKIFFFLFLATFCGSIFFSCRKEQSCEGCMNGNKPPVANAGPDGVITLPANTINLDGSGSTDPENNIVSYQWAKISGPPLFTIANTNVVQTQATSLVEGVYQFELKVTDNEGLSAKDTVRVMVNTQGLTEIIFTDLIWNLWVDSAAPGVFDEIYLWVSDTANMIPDVSNSNFSVWVKRDSTSNWEVASNIIINGNCTAPFWYHLAPSYLLIELCYPWDLSLVGKKGEVKIKF